MSNAGTTTQDPTTRAAVRTVLVTGTSSGIGLATAVALAEAGWTTIATMRDLTKAAAREDDPCARTDHRRARRRGDRAGRLGGMDRELVVLPLADGQQVGRRIVDADGKVVESDSLGEALRSGGSGAGDGVTPGATGGVTLDLAPGTYELVCDLAGHYAAGMYTVLVVT